MVRNQIFISYSHQDKEWLDKFQKNLKPYLRGSPVVAWDDTRIQAGANWREEINKALEAAKIAVLLVSSDFLASDFIFQEELPYLIKVAKEKEATIIPVAVRFSAWETAPFEVTQWANNPQTPLDAMTESECERELVKICKKVTGLFKPVTAPPVNDSPSITPPAPQTVSPVIAIDASAEAPASTMVEVASQSAEEGLRALVELMRNPEVQAKVATFEAVFATSSNQIEVLGYYKDLHDLLHTLQFKCYNYLISIVRTAKRDPNDLSVWDNVVEYELALQNILEGLDKAAEQTSLARALPWIQRLTQDLRALFQALEQNDLEKIEVAIRPIQRTLATEPSRINDRLSAAAAGLPLPMLVEALTGVRNSLDRARVNPVTVKKFVDGVHAIDGLKVNLTTLIDSHNVWQEVDIVLRRIEGNMAQDYSELEYSWNDLKAMTETQANGCEEQWAQVLKREIGKLDKALAEADTTRIRQSFQSFRTRANHRFYDVDLTLKELCAQLRKVGEPLAIVWEMIK